MILIVEGTDGVGKTEFCRWYAAKTGATYLHAGPPASNDAWAEYVDPLEAGRDYVLDRWHIGELVWPSLFGRTSLFKIPEVFSSVDETLALRGAQALIIYQDPNRIREVLKARDEHPAAITVSVEAQARLIRASTACRRTPISIIHSDVIHQVVTSCLL